MTQAPLPPTSCTGCAKLLQSLKTRLLPRLRMVAALPLPLLLLPLLLRRRRWVVVVVVVALPRPRLQCRLLLRR